MPNNALCRRPEVETDKYYEQLEQMDREFESICRMCGECCGSSDDPCVNLAEKGNGIYVCVCYDNRIGEQRTVSGKKFNCVPIREHIKNKSLRPNCAYQRFA